MRTLFAALLVVCSIASPAMAGDFRDLFNGKDFDGWVIEGAKTVRVAGEPMPVWSVKDGHIVADAARGSFGFLRYDKQEFSDFAFRVEYRLTPASPKQPLGNSGLGIRTMPFNPLLSRKTRPSFYSYEIQLMDDAGRPPSPHISGSLYRYLAPTKNAVRSAPEWNTIEVECMGPRIRVTFNGEKIIDADQNMIPNIKERDSVAPKDKALKGYVCLQAHTGRVEFRKVQIRELKK